jgi:site-specific DNA-methyltransferase (adenine-specific)
MTAPSVRAPRNRTLELTAAEEREYGRLLAQVSGPVALEAVRDRTICQDMMQVIPHLPSRSVDLLVLDPPYNLAKDFNGTKFERRSIVSYSDWMRAWFVPLLRLLKDTASVYLCGDWTTSLSIHEVIAEHLSVRTRITWEREKGRGAKANWKSCAEDVWFATVGNDYFFDADAVRLKRRVMAPYREDGRPKDWHEEDDGDFRLTNPSNLWSDITVPFWAMPENTEHPTQKPEKLLAKLILASSRPGDCVLDPFCGSGTTSVVARKLGRSFIGIELDRRYCCLAEKRLRMASEDRAIQGYAGGVFWERNTLQEQQRAARKLSAPPVEGDQRSLALDAE